MDFGSVTGSRSLRAALAMSGALALGCGLDASTSDLKPEGDPEILQVFVLEPDGLSRLAYGTHPEINPEVEDPLIPPAHGNQAGPVMNGLIAGGKIRVVVDELLDGATIEQFTCACTSCAVRAVVDPAGVDKCTACEDDPATTDINETGRCADANFDGVPDDAILQTGKLSLDCGVATVEILEDEGWYNPGGNQQIPTAGGTDAMGPALVFTPALLPTGADCLVVITGVTDKDGNAVPALDPAGTFHTEPMTSPSQAPAADETGVSTALALVTVSFNTPVDPASAANMTISPAVAGSTAAVSASEPNTVELTLGAALTPMTTYTVDAATVTDTFGSPAGYSYTFTTAP